MIDSSVQINKQASLNKISYMIKESKIRIDLNKPFCHLNLIILGKLMINLAKVIKMIFSQNN